MMHRFPSIAITPTKVIKPIPDALVYDVNEWISTTALTEQTWSKQTADVASTTIEKICNRLFYFYKVGITWQVNITSSTHLRIPKMLMKYAMLNPTDVPPPPLPAPDGCITTLIEKVQVTEKFQTIFVWTPARAIVQNLAYAVTKFWF